MAADLQETTVTYEQLAELEREFQEAETEILRHQTQLMRPLYEKRQQTVSQIPNFWPLVIEQSPQDIDEFIQPTDAALLLSSLHSLAVSRFEIESGTGGDPRSVSFRWEFNENEYFEDRVLEKKFWYRRDGAGWSGLVSEPVEIRWKEGKDLTGGLLGLVKRSFDEEQKLVKSGKLNLKAKSKELTPLQKELKDKLEEVGVGGLSFFAWFGYRGPSVSEEESRRAVEKERERRRLKLEGKKEKPEDEGKEDEEYDEYEGLEVFPEGDNLAVAIAEDLWPNAMKYFTQAQEQDELSDLEFESDMEEFDDADDDEGEPPAKKRKA